METQCIKCLQYCNSEEISKHLKKHCKVEKPFECYLCRNRFKRKENLQNHIYSIHQRSKDAKASHFCPNCSRSYHHKKDMVRHLRYQCGVEPRFQCAFCPHRATFKANLKLHVKSHHPGNIT